MSLILRSLQTIENEIVDLTEKVEELSFSQQEHIEESSNFQSHAGSNIEILNSKVLEIRQIVGSAAMASGKGISSTTSPRKRREKYKQVKKQKQKSNKTVETGIK